MLFHTIKVTLPPVPVSDNSFSQDLVRTQPPASNEERDIALSSIAES